MVMETEGTVGGDGDRGNSAWVVMETEGTVGGDGEVTVGEDGVEVARW